MPRSSNRSLGTAAATLRLLPLLLLLLLAAAPTGAGARPVGRAGTGGGGLGPLAAEDCAKAVPNCSQCRATKAATLCTACDFGYLVKSSGKGCWCAPGFYLSAPNTCSRCGLGFYCPGAKTTEASGSARLSCGRYRNTTTQTATSDKECVVNPGYSWGAGDTSKPCPAGTYNPGFNTRTKCQSCPGGLSTPAPGAADVTACVAAPGYAYDLGRAVPCAPGTYKELAGNEDCAECPEGFTTANATGLTSRRDCNRVLPGYQAPASTSLGVDAATLCPRGSYRGAEATFNPTTGTLCTPCPAFMDTLDEGSLTAEACLAPPGYGYNAATRAAALCAKGTYSEDWGRAPCASCGGGIVTTTAAGAASPDECFIPPGHFGVLAADNRTLSAAPCPRGTFGSAAPTFGIVASDCSDCPEHSTTRQEASTDALQCLADAGYGWGNDGLDECAAGSWSRGGAQDACTPCAEGYTTSSNGVDVTTGATGPEQCVIAPGWTPDGGGGSGLKQCVQGWYKAAVGPGACVQCPATTTTSLLWRATSLADCDACQPGFGNPAIDPARPACSLCPSGTFSIGRKAGGSACEPCPKPARFSGRMVSRRGSASPEACVPEFSSDGADNDDTWDLIPMDEAAATAPAPDATSVEACQAACAASPDCQYFSFRAFAPPAERCRLRDRVAFAQVDPADETKGYVLFELARGIFAAYPSHPTDGAALGVPLGAYATRAAAEAACRSSERCIGILFDPAAAAGARFRAFGGALFEGVTSKVRAAGADVLSPWLPEPDGLGGGGSGR